MALPQLVHGRASLRQLGLDCASSVQTLCVVSSTRGDAFHIVAEDGHALLAKRAKQDDRIFGCIFHFCWPRTEDNA